MTGTGSQPIASLARWCTFARFQHRNRPWLAKANFPLALGLPSPEEQFYEAMLRNVPLDESYSHRRRERSQLPLPKHDGLHVDLFQFTYLS
jgi:hypothetical protein